MNENLVLLYSTGTLPQVNEMTKDVYSLDCILELNITYWPWHFPNGELIKLEFGLADVGVQQPNSRG